MWRIVADGVANAKYSAKGTIERCRTEKFVIVFQSTTAFLAVFLIEMFYGLLGFFARGQGFNIEK